MLLPGNVMAGVFRADQHAATKATPAALLCVETLHSRFA
jgi:hypothetical protein